MTEHVPLQPLTDGQMETLEAAVKSYEGAMTVEVARYLMDRGLTQETVRTARLGVVADPIPAHQRFQGWLAIPYLVKGQPVRVRFRCLENHDHQVVHYSGKYSQPAGEQTMSYGIDSIFAAGGTIDLTEGELDRLILVQNGYHALGFPGANAFKSHHGRMLAGFNRVRVWGDPDQAGAEFITKVLNRLPVSGRGVQLKVGDVTDTFLQGGAEALHELAGAV